MQAVILVGGEGTRLRPLTYDLPKQLLPVLEESLIERMLAYLAAFGVERAVLSLGYRPDAFLAAFPSGHAAGVELAYAVEPTPLDTAGACRFAARQAGVTGTFLVLNGDVLTDFDLGSLYTSHHDSGAEATIMLTPVEDPSCFGVVPTDATGRVLAFIEKPPAASAPTRFINGGIYLLEPSVLDRIDGSRPVSIERETFPELVRDGTLYAQASESYWLDTGTPGSYLAAQFDLLGGRCRGPGAGIDPRATEGPSGAFLLPGAVAAGELVGRNFLGEGVVVEEGARICDAVLGRHVRVEAGAEVTGSLLLEDSVVRCSGVVEGSILGRGATVGHRASVRGLCVVGARAEVGDSELLTGARVSR